MRVPFWLLVGLGGFIGTVARWALTGAVTKGGFPVGTLVVNLAGSFLIGLLLFSGVAGGRLSGEARAFLAVGVLGGFTTMSSFAYETLSFSVGREHATALLNILFNVAGSLAAAFGGRAVGIWIWGGGP